MFSDLDFYLQDTTNHIEIEITIKEIPKELLRDSKYGLYVINDLEKNTQQSELSLIINLTVDESLEPKWVVKSRVDSDIDNKLISAQDRALLAVNYISDLTDNQFSYNKQSPLYSLTKNTLEDSTSIERIKSQMIRSMTSSISSEQFNQLNSPLSNLKSTAEKLGPTLGEISVLVDIKENPYTGNSIALHDESLPYRLHGKGSKRLMSIAIQMELTKSGGIVLIDELEQGLEPDRIITLVRLLKETSEGQVFITTHSLNVILEAKWHNLFLVNKGNNYLSIISEDLDSCRRTNPQAFFARRIICCEGKTELGFIRAIDQWISNNCNSNFSSNGIIIVNAEGGNKMFTFAEKFQSIGLDCCIFADNDKYKELEKYIEKVQNLNIPLYLCEKGLCFESQIFKDIPWSKIKLLTDCSEADLPINNINIPTNIATKIGKKCTQTEEQEIRKELTNLSISNKKEWFKNIPGGEFLGRVMLDLYSELSENCKTKENINNIIEWSRIKK